MAGRPGILLKTEYFFREICLRFEGFCWVKLRLKRNGDDTMPRYWMDAFDC